MKNKSNYYYISLFIVLLLSNIFMNKIIYIAPKLNIGLGLIIYSLSFLIVGIMINNNKLKYCKNIILKSAILVFVFYLIISIFSSINGVDDALEITNSIRNIFTPNTITILGLKLYYPHLVSLISLLVIYYFTHYIFLIIYDIIKDNASEIVAFIMAILISFILDQMLYTSITNLYAVLNNIMSVNEFIRLLTASFIVLLLETIIMVVIFPIFIKKKN